MIAVTSIMVGILLTTLTNAAPQNANLQLVKIGNDIQAKWDPAQCTFEKSQWGNKRYYIGVRVWNTAGAPLWARTTNQRCILIPDSLFSPGFVYEILLSYHGKRLNKKGKCRGFKLSRSYALQAFQGSLQKTDTVVKRQFIENVQIFQCPYQWFGAFYTWDCWHSGAKHFYVSQPVTPVSHDYYKFRHVDSGKCIVPARGGNWPGWHRMAAGSCEDCRSVFKGQSVGAGLRFRNQESIRCLQVGTGNGMHLRQHTCNMGAWQQWKLVDV